MIKFTSIIPMSEEKTPLSLEWADKNFELTYQGNQKKSNRVKKKEEGRETLLLFLFISKKNSIFEKKNKLYR